ncbi:MAG: hypothetical protein ACT4P3_13810 [Betaproteobacteria bacterium]
MKTLRLGLLVLREGRRGEQQGRGEVLARVRIMGFSRGSDDPLRARGMPAGNATCTARP